MTTEVFERLDSRNRDLVRKATKAAGISGGSYRSKAENVALLVEKNVVDITDDGEPVFSMQVVHDAAEAARAARSTAEVVKEARASTFGVKGLAHPDHQTEEEGAADPGDPDVSGRAPEADSAPDVTFKVNIDTNGDSVLVVVVDGEMHTVRSTALNYSRLVTALLAGDDPRPFLTDDLTALLNWVSTVISDRVSIDHARSADGEAHARLFIDDEEVHGKVVDQFKRYWLEGRDPQNLVRFLERVKDNPLPVAETNLYDWGSALTIDKDGYFIGFKAVKPAGTDEEGNQVFEPSRYGPGYVNGERPEDGRLRQKVGDVVTIDRDLVTPGPECAVGLHVGTWRYAKGFISGGVVMEVRVDPADIVNVPSYETGKLRCVKYEVIGFHDANGVLDHLEPEAEWDEEAATAAVMETVEDEVARGFFRRLFRRGK